MIVASATRRGGLVTSASGGVVTDVAPPGLTVRVESFVGPLDLLLHLCRTTSWTWRACPSAR